MKPTGSRARRVAPAPQYGVNMMRMTTTFEVPDLHTPDDTDAARAHRALFSDPDAVKLTAVHDLDASRAAAQAPLFSSPY